MRNVKMTGRAFFLTLVLAAIAFGAAPARAMIVNIDSKFHTVADPLIIAFGPGDYLVDPIDVADGGAYNAWNPWGNNVTQNCAADGTCPSWPDGKGWDDLYIIATPYGSTVYASGSLYATDLLALAHAIAGGFTLPAGGEVKFFIADSNHNDNYGGISLSVTQKTPEPSTLILLGAGLTGAALFRRFAREAR